MISARRTYLLFVILATTAGAQHEAAPGSDPWMMTPVGDQIIFAATTSYHGRELWRYAPATGITDIVKDISPYFSDGFDTQKDNFLAPGGGGVLFLARQHRNDGLWRSDGTAEGTYRILPYDLGRHPLPSFIHRINNISLLSVESSSYEPEIVAVTDAGNLYTLPEAPLGKSQRPGWIATHDSKGLLVFEKSFNSSRDTIEGVSLTDGTPEGTRTYPDSPLIGHTISSYYGPEHVGSTTYFLISPGREPNTLWRFDDPEKGPELVAEIPQDFTRIDMARSLGNLLIIVCEDETHGNEPWVFDLERGDFALLADIQPGPANGEPYQFSSELNGEVYFSAMDGVHGRELWKTDGTTQGTQMVADIYPGAGDAHPYRPRILNGRMLFGVNSPRYGEELWTTDGTAAGTHMVKDINPGKAFAEPYNFSVIGDRMYFSAITAKHGCELWVTDGTEDGTFLIADINRPPGPRTSSKPKFLHAEGSLVYFVADTRDETHALWRSDGSEAGTVQITSIPAAFGEIVDVVTLNGISYALADGQGRRKLWRMNEGGCEDALGDAARLPGDARFVRQGDALFFPASTDANGCELWHVQGNTVERVTDINPGPGDANPRAFYASEDRLLFSANNGAQGNEPWAFADGVATLLADIAPGQASSSPREFADGGSGEIFVVADDQRSGPELWKIPPDGDPVLLRDIYPINSGAYLPAPAQLVLSQGTLYFTATDGTHGVELWASDGTPETTRMLRDITVRAGGSSYPRDLTPNEDGIYFSAYAVGKGRELWRSDGTEKGTYMVADAGGIESTGPEELVLVDGVLCYSYFMFPHDGPRGREFNAHTTLPYGEIRVGEAGSYPEELTLAGDRIFFRADDGWHGQELWAFEVPTARLYMVRDILPDAPENLLAHTRANHAPATP